MILMLFFRKRSYKSLRDEALIEAYCSHDDRDALGELFERYTHLVRGLCVKYLSDRDAADDAVIAIFEKLMKDLKKQKISSFKSWLFIVSKNYCLMLIRERKVMAERAEAAEYYLNSYEGITPEKEAQLTQLESAIAELSPEQRACVELFYLREMCYRDIADLTGYDLNQVKSYIQNGKRNLKLALMQEIKGHE